MAFKPVQLSKRRFGLNPPPLRYRVQCEGSRLIVIISASIREEVGFNPAGWRLEVDRKAGAGRVVALDSHDGLPSTCGARKSQGSQSVRLEWPYREEVSEIFPLVKEVTALRFLKVDDGAIYFELPGNVEAMNEGEDEREEPVKKAGASASNEEEEDEEEGEEEDVVELMREAVRLRDHVGLPLSEVIEELGCDRDRVVELLREGRRLCMEGKLKI